MTNSLKALSDKVSFVNTVIESLTNPIDIDIVIANDSLFRFGLDLSSEGYLSAIISLIERLLEYLWGLQKSLIEQMKAEEWSVI